MNRSHLFFSAALGCALLVGCEKQSETPTGAPANNPQATEDAADATKSKTEDASERAKDMADNAGDTLQQQAENASDSMKKNADTVAEAANSSPAVADASAKIQQVMDDIKNKRLPQAEATLKTLEANKASLPQPVQTQIDNARKMLDAAKSGASTTQPAQ